MSARKSRTGQGSNSAQVRLYNERIVLQALRRFGEASKTDLARAAGLTNNAVGVITAYLEAAGLVVELGKKREGQRGQPASHPVFAAGSRRRWRSTVPAIAPCGWRPVACR